MAPKPTNPNEKNDTLRIAKWLDNYLNPETILEIEYPSDLQGDYLNFAKGQKRKWFEFTYRETVIDANRALKTIFGRKLKLYELSLMKRKIRIYLEKWESLMK